MCGSHMKKIIFCFFLLYCSFGFSDLTKTYRIQDSDKDNYKNEGTYFSKYDLKFSKKYHLSPKYTENLTPGLLAIEIVLSKKRFFEPGIIQILFPDRIFTKEQEKEINEAIPALEIIFFKNQKLPLHYHYDCYINLYLDHDLSIDYPEDATEGQGDFAKYVLRDGLEPIKQMLFEQNREEVYPLLLKKQDDEIDEHFSHRAFLVNRKDIANRKKYIDFIFDRYQNNFYQKIDFIALGPDDHCQCFSKIKSDELVLIKKKDSNQFYVFEIPDSVLPDSQNKPFVQATT